MPVDKARWFYAVQGGRGDPHEFDPSDIERIFAQDEAGECGDPLPNTMTGWSGDVRRCLTIFDGQNITVDTSALWRCEMPDKAFVVYIQALRNAMLLPLSRPFLDAIDDVLFMAEREARRRIARKERPKSEDDWETSDFLSEVEAKNGEGRRVGREWWFRCSDEKTASLHVNPEDRTFFCFKCGVGGGVYAFRRGHGAWQTARTR